MACIGLIKEGKIPADNRVALTPAQARLLQQQFADCTIIVEPSADRCFSDDEYRKAGIEVSDNLENCEILLGIKEIPIAQLLPDKTYLFFPIPRKSNLITGP